MKKRVTGSFALLMSLCFILNCGKNSSPINTNPEDGPVYITLSVSPDSGYVGDIIEITGMQFEAEASDNLIQFKGEEPERADSGHQDLLYSYVPFEANNGPIEISHFGEDTIGVIENFKFLKECDTTQLCILPYNLNEVITKSKASQRYRYSDERVNWQAEQLGDTIRVFRLLEGDVGALYEMEFLHLGDGILPELLEISLTRIPDTGGSFKEVIERGVLKIQDWDTSAVVSGRFVSRMWTHDFKFWFDFSDTSQATAN